jgi:hydroxymethylpyrimidine/phosphomethylpyrimidine kinase
VDLLWRAGAEPIWMEAPRIDSANTHGTGCTLSSAIAAHLALGLDLPGAVLAARDYVRSALQAGASVRTGQGSGPLNHGFAPQVMRRTALSAA